MIKTKTNRIRESQRTNNDSKKIAADNLIQHANKDMTNPVLAKRASATIQYRSFKRKRKFNYMIIRQENCGHSKCPWETDAIYRVSFPRTFTADCKYLQKDK